MKNKDSFSITFNRRSHETERKILMVLDHQNQLSRDADKIVVNTKVNFKSRLFSKMQEKRVIAAQHIVCSVQCGD